jgi:hypothetical protein
MLAADLQDEILCRTPQNPVRAAVDRGEGLATVAPTNIYKFRLL